MNIDPPTPINAPEPSIALRSWLDWVASARTNPTIVEPISWQEHRLRLGTWDFRRTREANFSGGHDSKLGRNGSCANDLDDPRSIAWGRSVGRMAGDVLTRTDSQCFADRPWVGTIPVIPRSQPRGTVVCAHEANDARSEAPTNQEVMARRSRKAAHERSQSTEVLSRGRKSRVCADEANVRRPKPLTDQEVTAWNPRKAAHARSQSAKVPSRHRKSRVCANEANARSFEVHAGQTVMAWGPRKQAHASRESRARSILGSARLEWGESRGSSHSRGARDPIDFHAPSLLGARPGSGWPAPDIGKEPPDR